MAGTQDFLNLGGLDLGKLGQETSDLVGRTALLRELAQKRFRKRTVPRLAGREATKGTFFSGGARRRGREAQEDSVIQPVGQELLGRSGGLANVALSRTLGRLFG